ncbi:fructose-bisphosphatase class III [Brochothrix thermosphacta]|uniref:Fructose-1,6-bisphosphatase class 3 n=1 Tax=Brochothrix thermosphacta TaxID=2756 RepID=A0A1D2LZ08_BROTH|nr:fructose-bisphosphatase class III [Brochothrix thermosphacta]ATF25632.1 fructose-bisphosphatase class III [Brochothrix thermosphacta]ATH84976.1 fructose-bisphosphatase class III [Brochothrix thermosphacta]MPQ29525.1 fructose-bisphosphatase class III [Brochothrix thermosphacta]ODJ66168.1 fructose 1,6-bisphosphatase [Brochothrix thermosphacta]ODJ73703.1 fructose 1,6-bisphosphatase [Brochothrix thermosphacta]
MSKEQEKYLNLLSKQYKNKAETITEIINLEAILNLPKGTEHFLSDLHGEYDAFEQVFRNGSGVIKRKIHHLFNDRLTSKEINTLATLIYYPRPKMSLILRELNDTEKNEWYRLTILRLIELTNFVSSKYTRSKVRKQMPSDFIYIIEELLYQNNAQIEKDDYYNEIITSLIHLNAAQDLIHAFSKLIRRLVVDHLHIVGDVFDRGPAPDKIIGRLKENHSLDFQWGNHDMIWMGAASGSAVCLANVLRISARYLNLDTVEESYGISLRSLAIFADEVYANDPATAFQPKTQEHAEETTTELQQIARMHKAIAIIQFKLEGEIIQRHPEFNMENRRLLDKIDYAAGTISIAGKDYLLTDTHFPTINPKSPYTLTPEESEVIHRLVSGFVNSEKLQEHVAFLYSKGSMYLRYNGNLIYHGCIPLDDDGSFEKLLIAGKTYSGRSLLDQFDRFARKAYSQPDGSEIKKNALDYVWYLWTGETSPLFGKKAMTTFERYFIEDKTTHYEKKNAYYQLRNNVSTVDKILVEFDLNPDIGHIVNGHTPIKEGKGETPIKADGKMLVIDGGFSKAYHNVTSIAGYTLIYNAYGLQLVRHQPFTSTEDAISNETDIVSTRRIIETETSRKMVKDTDIGFKLTAQITDLKALLLAYRSGIIKEKNV